MILFLDTTTEATKLILMNSEGSFIDRREWLSYRNQSEELLSNIEEFLKSNKLSKHDLCAIAVNNGTGSYTGVRVGVTTANFLGFGLNIPVLAATSQEDINFADIKARQFEKPALPIYQRPPHITVPKARA